MCFARCTDRILAFERNPLFIRKRRNAGALSEFQVSRKAPVELSRNQFMTHVVTLNLSHNQTCCLIEAWFLFVMLQRLAM